MNTSSAGLPDLMDNVANSFTLSLRTISYQPTAQGDAFAYRAVVAWYWMILPIFVELVASLLLLIAVMNETSKKGLMPWTNHILPYFFHGFDHLSADRLTLKSQKEISNESRRLLVGCEPRGKGGRLTVTREERYVGYWQRSAMLGVTLDVLEKTMKSF